MYRLNLVISYQKLPVNTENLEMWPYYYNDILKVTMSLPAVNGQLSYL
jgi:hypothetical protein